MRLAYAEDATGRLEPAFTRDAEPTSITRLALAPQREPSRRRAALVVDADPDMRIIFRRVLEASGYEVVTCAGPDSTSCEGAEIGAAAAPCPLVDEATCLVVVDERVERTRLPEAYAAWAPLAQVDHSVR